MFRKLMALSWILVFVFMLGCSTHMHTMGSGAAGANETSSRQWYILFGLVPLNSVDTKTMAGGATDYNIKTQQSFLDIVITIFTGIVTVNSRTVTVTK